MNRRMILALAVVTFAVAVPVLAHHAWPVDRSKEVTVKGTVTGFNWLNPHVMIDLEIKTDSGKVEKWSVGGPSVERRPAMAGTRPR